MPSSARQPRRAAGAARVGAARLRIRVDDRADQRGRRRSARAARRRAASATTGALMSAPRSKRDDASVFRPSRLLVRRTDAGLKYALSKATRRRRRRDFGAAPPMTPATACARSRSAMTSMSGSSVRVDAVERRDASRRRARGGRGSRAPASVAQVERVHRLAELEQHVVGDVDDRADRPDAGGLQPRRHPGGRRRRASRRRPPPRSAGTARRPRCVTVSRSDSPTGIAASRTGAPGLGRRQRERAGRRPWRPRARGRATLRQSGRLAVTSKSITASPPSSGSIDADLEAAQRRASRRSPRPTP